MLTNDELSKWDRESLFHPSTNLGQFARGEGPQRIVSGAEGVYVTDRDGNRLLDGFAGLYCVNVGYGRPEIADAHEALTALLGGRRHPEAERALRPVSQRDGGRPEVEPDGPDDVGGCRGDRRRGRRCRGRRRGRRGGGRRAALSVISAPGPSAPA